VVKYLWAWKLERGGCSVEAAENKATMRRIMEHVINEKNLDAA
jgi:hypothetical protein